MENQEIKNSNTESLDQNNNLELNQEVDIEDKENLHITDKNTKTTSNVSIISSDASGVVGNIIAIFKNLFSSRPLEIFKLKLSNSIFGILLALHILFGAWLFSSKIVSLITGFFTLLTSMIGGAESLPSDIEMVISLLGSKSFIFFILFIFVFAIILLIATVIIMVIANVTKVQRKNFASVLKLIALATTPLTIAYLAILLFGWIPGLGIYLSVALYNAGFLSSLLLIYLGIQKYLGTPQKSPLWASVIGFTVFLLIILFVFKTTGMIMAEIIKSAIMSSNVTNFFR